MLSCVGLFATPWTVARQAPLSMRFSRQEYWRRLPFSSPGDLPNPGIEPEPKPKAKYPVSPAGRVSLAFNKCCFFVVVVIVLVQTRSSDYTQKLKSERTFNVETLLKTQRELNTDVEAMGL